MGDGGRLGAPAAVWGWRLSGGTAARRGGEMFAWTASVPCLPATPPADDYRARRGNGSGEQVGQASGRARQSGGKTPYAFWRGAGLKDNRPSAGLGLRHARGRLGRG